MHRLGMLSVVVVSICLSSIATAGGYSIIGPMPDTSAIPAPRTAAPGVDSLSISTSVVASPSLLPSNASTTELTPEPIRPVMLWTRQQLRTLELAWWRLNLLFKERDNLKAERQRIEDESNTVRIARNKLRKKIFEMLKTDDDPSKSPIDALRLAYTAACRDKASIFERSWFDRTITSYFNQTVRTRTDLEREISLLRIQIGTLQETDLSEVSGEELAQTEYEIQQAIEALRRQIDEMSTRMAALMELEEALQATVDGYTEAETGIVQAFFLASPALMKAYFEGKTMNRLAQKQAENLNACALEFLKANIDLFLLVEEWLTADSSLNRDQEAIDLIDQRLAELAELLKPTP